MKLKRVISTKPAGTIFKDCVLLEEIHLSFYATADMTGEERDAAAKELSNQHFLNVLVAAVNKSAFASSVIEKCVLAIGH